MSRTKKIIFLFGWCAATYWAGTIAGIFFGEWKSLFMFWAGMANLWGYLELKNMKVAR